MPPNYANLNYNRFKAVSYANKWAYYRNPNYYDFSNIGGDCTNFASQSLYAGAGVMNYTPTFGWYYNSVNDRAPAWTGVEEFYNFITTNEEEGPYGEEVDIMKIRPGDFVQIKFPDGEERFQHTPVVTSIEGFPSISTIFVAAHSNDVNCRPLNSYDIKQIRFIHILGVRKLIESI